MGKSDAKKRLRRIEREIDHFREQQMRYDRMIEELKGRKQELLNRLNPEQGKLNAHQRRIDPDPGEGMANRGGISGNMERVRESCLRVRAALDKVNRAGGELIARAGLEEELTTRTGEKQKGQGVDILEVLNSPKFREIANDLLGELLKDS